MKKIYSFLFAAASLLAVSSCQEEIVDPNPEILDTPVVKITASVGAETKTVLGDNGVSTYWVAGDKISVFDATYGDNNRRFSIETEIAEPSQTATFACTDEQGFGFPADQTQDEALLVALYPYQENAYCDFFDPADGNNIISGLNIPTVQNAVKGKFDPAATFALATVKYADRENVHFKNVYTLLKVTLLEEGVNSVFVSFGEEEYVTGNAQILLNVDQEAAAFKGGLLSAVNSDTAPAYNYVTLKCAEGETFEPGANYYVAVAPVSYSKIAVALNTPDNVVKAANVNKTFAANTIYDVLNIDDPKTVADGVYLNEDGVYEISNEAGLFWLADQVNNGTEYFAGKIVKLVADIDLDGKEWTPIGSASKDHGFMGNFDGNGKTIKNLKISDIALDEDGYAYAGLFGVTEGTDKDNQNCIKNLTVENVEISTAGHIVAAAIAYPYYTVVENITVKGEISIKGGDYTAGVLAYTRKCIDVSDISIEGNDGSSIEGRMTVGGVISDIQMNGGLTANYSNFKASGLIIKAKMHVGGISGIIGKQTLNGATVENVNIVCEDVRKGMVSGSLGETSTIKNISVENVTGAINVVGATFKGGAAVVGDENGVYTAKVWAERNLAFAEESGTATYGEDFELPILTGEGDLTKAVYTVTEGDAAKVSEAGVVTLVKGGTVIITATVPADDTHLAGEATYTLTVEIAEFNPVDGYIYLRPSENWKEANARFAAYFFGSGEPVWESMELVKGQLDIYQCSIPAKKTMVIFCRMNPNTQENNFNDGVRWTQTENLSMLKGCLYTVSEWTDGAWSGDPAVDPVDASGLVVGFSGSAIGWDDPSFDAGDRATLKSKELTDEATYAGTYIFELTDLNVAANDKLKVRIKGDWIGSGSATISGISLGTADSDGNFVVTGSGTYDVTITFVWDGANYSNVNVTFAKQGDTEPEPEQEVRIYLHKNWEWGDIRIWCWVMNTESNIFSSKSWPGELPHGTETIGGKTYLYWTVPDESVGKKVGLLINGLDNGNRKQTQNYENVILDQDQCFKFEWNSTKGDHLITTTK